MKEKKTCLFLLSDQSHAAVPFGPDGTAVRLLSQRLSTAWLVGRGDGLTAPVPPTLSFSNGWFVSLDKRLMGLAASIPSDLGGTARWHLSWTFINLCPSISIGIPSTMGIVDLTAPIPSTVVGRHVGSLPVWSFCRDVE